MKRKAGFVLLLVVLAAAFGVALVEAQGPQPGGPHVSSANAGTAFTYQGQLKNGGNAVNGPCDFQFGLWDALTLGAQVGVTQTVTGVSVSNGLFTTPVDFGANAVTGDARWLQIAVRCPAGSVSFTPLAPRQPLTPAPLALALPGLYTQQTSSVPNVIGGYSGNVITPTVVGGTISGGGSEGNKNQVLVDYAAVAGGQGNIAGNYGAMTGGGLNNHNYGAEGFLGGGQNNFISQSGMNAIISGGSYNQATANRATIGGGSGNQATDEYTTISGGASNVASKSNATVGGGLLNTASDFYATVSGGQVNTASRDHSFVGGGAGNNANMSYATIGGGSGNVITSTAMYGTVPGGVGAQATHFGELAYASGSFNTPGDAQTSVYVLRNSVIGASSSELFLDGASQRLTIADNRTVAFDILVVGRSASGTSAGYQFRGVIKKYSGTTSIVGSVSKTPIAEDDATWDANVTADNANSALKITANGSGLLTSYWVASVRTVEFGY